MASAAHLKLSDCIKQLHCDLRALNRVHGADEAWRLHLSNPTRLAEYANSMKTLANDYWQESKNDSRIEWTVKTCRDYKEDIQNWRDRERLVLPQILECDTVSSQMIDFDDRNIKLLDVGSCYNPFNNFEDFDVTAIDIAPAPDSGVQQCDFLSIDIDGVNSDFHSSSFDVVVFCLLLEYLPSPHQRLKCCANAYKLLKPEGLLIIITPDSKHQSSINSRLRKNWRYILGNLGFVRIKYEKSRHIACMAFRKAMNEQVAKRWSELHKEDYMTEELNIPQDFNSRETQSDDNEKQKSPVNTEETRDFFLELPDL